MAEEDSVGCDTDRLGHKLLDRHRSELAVEQPDLVPIVDERAPNGDQTEWRQVVVRNPASDGRMWDVDQENAHVRGSARTGAS